MLCVRVPCAQRQQFEPGPIHSADLRALQVLLREGEVFAEAVCHWLHESGALTEVAKVFSELASS